MPPSLQFGVDQGAVCLYFEASAIRGNQSHRFDDMLVFPEQLLCQAYSPVGVMSDRAIGDFDFEHILSTFSGEDCLIRDPHPANL